MKQAQTSQAATSPEKTQRPCRIDINGRRTIAVAPGGSLLSVLADHDIRLPSACGGRAACGLCKLKVLSDAGPILPPEAKRLSQTEQAGRVRLACQVLVNADLSIRIPDELLTVAEYRCVCAGIEDLTADMKRFHLKLEDPPAIDFIPGQYVQLCCPAYPGHAEELWRAYSVASDPARNDAIDLIIRRTANGISTTYCFDYLKTGDGVRINGPYGDFHLSDAQTPMLFIAGGSGIAPFVSILHHMRNISIARKVAFLFGANRVRDLCLIDEMRQFERTISNFTFIPVVAEPEPDSGWTGETGLVTQAVDRMFTDLNGYEAYLCGSPGMIDAAIAVLSRKNLPDDRIFYDKFA